MILILVLATWIVALAVVTGLCVSAGRGDASLRRQTLDPGHEELFAAALDRVAPGTGRRPGTISRRQLEHEPARVERVAVG